MKSILFLSTFILLFHFNSSGQDVFSEVTYGSLKTTIARSSLSPSNLNFNYGFDVLWKSKKKQLTYNGISFIFGIDGPQYFTIGLGHKSVFGLKYDEDYNNHNLGIESYGGLSYKVLNGKPENQYDISHISLDAGAGLRFRIFQNMGGKIMFNFSLPLNTDSYEFLDKFRVSHGLSFGIVSPLWVNKKSIFKRGKLLKIKQGE